jgi:hypothetical protein
VAGGARALNSKGRGFAPTTIVRPVRGRRLMPAELADEVHKVMRQAAFDQKVTMQEILRRGLKMWLVAHDYKFPPDE